ncbi:MAG: Acetyltransferase protein, partial [Nocardioides sp.]|nr:Acetyltransferase protein [Nocardioides sp.]
MAAAILTDFAGSVRDVGVLVAPGARGRGLATRVGAQAASYAIANSGLARWRARVTNDASLAVATR